MQSSILQFRMAGNAQFRESAFQRAQGVTSGIFQGIENFPVVGGAGYLLCRDKSVSTACAENLGALDTAIVSVPPGVMLDYKVQRQRPVFSGSLPFRLSQNRVFSASRSRVASFETHVEIDGSRVGLGSAEIVQGVAVVVFSEINQSPE
ncbi:MAG: hypothetical protein V7746_25935 [Halioglobus sp.]